MFCFFKTLKNSILFISKISKINKNLQKEIKNFSLNFQIFLFRKNSQLKINFHNYLKIWLKVQQKSTDGSNEKEEFKD